MRLPIYVTRKDIANGDCQDGEYCPIALSVKRKIVDNCGDIYIDGDGAIQLDGNTISKASLKRERFITKFDSYRKVSPIYFLLNIPKKFVKARYRNKGK